MSKEVSLPELKAGAALEDAGGQGEKISSLEVLLMVAERKRLVGQIAAVFLLVAIVAALVLPKRYTATVTLLPPQQNTSLASALTSQLGSLGGVAALAGGSSAGSLLKSPNDMFVAMLKSRTVEDAMVQRFGLMQEYHERYLSDTRTAFEKHTAVDGSGKDGLIRISVEDRNPRRAAELANGYVDQFRTLSQHLAISEASQRRLFFEQELAQAKDNLAKAEETLKLTQQTTGMIQLDSQARALIASAASLRAEVAAKEVEIGGMRSYATGENAQLLQAQRELDSLKEQLTKLGGSGNANSDELLIPKGRVPEAGLEYARKLRDVKYYETIFDILARQFEVAKLDEAKEGALIQVVDAAVPPDKRSFPKRSLIVIGGLLAGLIFGILAALAQCGYHRMKDDPKASIKLSRLLRSLSFKQQ